MMKRNLIRGLGACALGLGLSTGAWAQAFEGIIEFTKTTGPVITVYKYYVKGDHVRIEEISARGEVQGIMLVDMRDKTRHCPEPGTQALHGRARTCACPRTWRPRWRRPVT